MAELRSCIMAYAADHGAAVGELWPRGAASAPLARAAARRRLLKRRCRGLGPAAADSQIRAAGLALSHSHIRLALPAARRSFFSPYPQSLLHH
jgi:hypothetical protein